VGYRDTGNLVRAAIGEQLVNIAREVDSLASRLASLLSGEPPSFDDVDKFYRQDVALARNNVDRMVRRIFEYVASGRMSLVDSRDVLFDALEEYERLVRSVEEAVHRIRHLSPSSPAYPGASRLASLLAEAARELVSLARHVADHGEAGLVVERAASTVMTVEREADEAYRASLDSLLEADLGYKQLLVGKDVLDLLESAVDSAERISRLLRIIALAESVA